MFYFFWNCKIVSSLNLSPTCNARFHLMNIQFSPKGSILASCSNDTTIKIWDIIETSELLHTLRLLSLEGDKGHTDTVVSINY